MRFFKRLKITALEFPVGFQNLYWTSLGPSFWCTSLDPRSRQGMALRVGGMIVGCEGITLTQVCMKSFIVER